MKERINNKGFSLLELLICVAISGFVILAAYSLVMVGTKSYETNSKTTSLQQEVSYTNNLIGETIRPSYQNDTYILYDGDNIELHTGKKVLYYDKAKNTLCIYNEVLGGVYNTSSEDNLITKYAVDFNAEFVNNVDDGTDESTSVLPNTWRTKWKDAATGIIKAEHCTNLIKVTITFEYKGKKDTSEVIYQIRNSSVS